MNNMSYRGGVSLIITERRNGTNTLSFFRLPNYIRREASR